MIVAQADADGGVTTLWRMKEPVGLGRMSFPSRRLSDEAIERAIGVLARFLQAAKLRQAEKIVAVATSAVREASNGGDLIERVKRELGQYVRVVSAREEARLIYIAVRHAMPLDDQAASDRRHRRRQRGIHRRATEKRPRCWRAESSARPA